MAPFKRDSFVSYSVKLSVHVAEREFKHTRRASFRLIIWFAGTTVSAELAVCVSIKASQNS